MAVRLDKNWIPFQAESVNAMACHLGVYQLGNDDDEIVYIGVAGGRSLFGLKGELRSHLAAPPLGATRYRFEVNMMYRTRHMELLAAFVHDHGALPAGNEDIDITTLGRIRPYG